MLDNDTRAAAGLPPLPVRGDATPATLTADGTRQDAPSTPQTKPSPPRTSSPATPVRGGRMARIARLDARTRELQADVRAAQAAHVSPSDRPDLPLCERAMGPTVERLADADERIARGRGLLLETTDPVKREAIERRLFVLEACRIGLVRNLEEYGPYGETRIQEIVRRHREGTLDQLPPMPPYCDR